MALAPVRAQGAVPADGAALERAIAAVAREIEQAKAQLYQTVNSHYGEFVSTAKSTADLNIKVADVARNVQQLLEQVDGVQAAYHANAVAPAAEVQHLRTQLVTSGTLVAVLQHLASLHDLIQEVDSDLDIGEYVQAAHRVQSMAAVVAELTRHKENGVDAEIMRIVKDEYLKRKSTLRHRLLDMFARAVTIRTTALDTEVVVESRVGSAPPYDSPVPWTDVLAALGALDLLRDEVAVLCERLQTAIVVPLLRTPGASISVRAASKTTVVLALATPRQSVVASSVRGDAAPAPAPRRVLDAAAADVMEPTTETVFADCAKVAQFVRSHVLPSNDAAALLPTLWWPAISEAVVREALVVALPDAVDGLAAYTATIAKAAAVLEERLLEAGVCPDDDRRISDWLANVHAHFWEKRRAAALVLARDLLAGADHNTVQVTDATERGGLTAASGADKLAAAASAAPGTAAAKEGKEVLEPIEGLFRLRTCHISVRTQALVEMVYQTLSECRGAPPLGAMQLFYSARDMLDLFRAVVPVYHANEIESVPLLAMIFVNDCLYIAHHLMTLGYQFHTLLPSPLKETATFVDMVPLFRRLAEQTYRHQMRKQEQQLLEFIHGAEGFGETHKDDRNQAVTRALNQAMMHLGLLSKVWMPVMTTELYLAAMGALVDVVLGAVTKGIQALKDISDSEGEQLHQLCQSVLARAEPLFVVRDAIAGGSGAAKAVPPATHCRQWQKLVVLDRLLLISLQDIPTEWEKGALRPFTASEVRALVVAVFQDSNKRAQVLKRLQD